MVHLSAERPSFLWFDLNDWFLGRGYYCHLCEKGYNTDKFDHYPCILRRCVGRKLKDCGDYKLHRLADRPVRRATKCPATHVNVPSRSGIQRSCTYTPVRSDVNKINLWKSGRKRQRPHKCWAYFCKTFKDCADIGIHKCFVQSVGEEESFNDLGLQVKGPCRNRAPRRAFHAFGLLDRNVSSDSYSEEENWEEVNGAKLPPYFVYEDYECTKKEHEHVPHPHFPHLGWSQDLEFEVRLSEFHPFHPVLPLWWYSHVSSVWGLC